MKLLNVKLLMGHDTGLEKSYYKPSESELLQDYLQAVNELTINEEFRLKMKISDLESRQDEIDLLRLKYEQDKTEMDQKLDKIMSMIRENPKLANAKVDSLKKKMN